MAGHRSLLKGEDNNEEEDVGMFGSVKSGASNYWLTLLVLAVIVACAVLGGAVYYQYIYIEFLEQRLAIAEKNAAEARGMAWSAMQHQRAPQSKSAI